MGWYWWLLIPLSILLALVAVIMAAGSLLPRSHRVGRAVVLRQTPETVWQTITDFPAAPTWHKGVIKVERMPDRNGHEIWRETYQGNYGLQLETLDAVALQRLVRSIADEKGPFSGRWEFELKPAEQGCRLVTTEFGEIPNPFFRVMARLFMDPAMYLELYLKALASKFGESANLEKIETAHSPE